MFRALEKWARVHPSDRGHACATCRAKVAARCAAAAEAAKAAGASKGGSEGAESATASAAAASVDVSGCPGELGGKEQCSSCSSSGGYTSLQSVLHVPPHRRDKASCLLPAHAHCWLGGRGFQALCASFARRLFAALHLPQNAILLEIPLLAFASPRHSSFAPLHLLRLQMESFFVAETLKYLYLIFAEPPDRCLHPSCASAAGPAANAGAASGVAAQQATQQGTQQQQGGARRSRLPLDAYIFTTEAHPLPFVGPANGSWVGQVFQPSRCQLRPFEREAEQVAAAAAAAGNTDGPAAVESPSRAATEQRQQQQQAEQAASESAAKADQQQQQQPQPQDQRAAQAATEASAAETAAEL